MNDQLMDSLLQQMIAENPKLTALMQIMKQQQAGTEVPQSRPESLEAEKNKRRSLLRRMRKMQQEINSLGSFVDELAVSLGACAHCWGTLPDCAGCHGKGTPGFYPPDKAGFQHYVLPVVRNTPWAKQMLIKELKI